MILAGIIWRAYAHIKSGWKSNRNRIAGSLLIVSGLFLYYAVDTREAALWVHWVIGGGLVLLFPAHYLLGRRVNQSTRKQH